MWSFVILWTVAAVEFLIWCYFCVYVVLYVIPWRELREKRDISRGIARRLPALRARVRHAARRAVAAPLIQNPLRLREICRHMTEDAVGLAAHCARLADTIAREHRAWPREMLLLEDILDKTLGVLGEMCAMRNAELPALTRVCVQTALDRITHVDEMRTHLLARSDVLAAEGTCYDYEAGCLNRMGTALQAHRLLARADPSKVIKVSARWVARLRLISESMELRRMTRRRLNEVRSLFPERAERVLLLLHAVRALLPIVRGTSAHKDVAFRMAALEAAHEDIAKAEGGMSEAAIVCRTAGVDVGVSGESGRALIEALRSVERANALLTSLEDDLTFIAAVAAAASREHSRSMH